MIGMTFRRWLGGAGRRWATLLAVLTASLLMLAGGAIAAEGGGCGGGGHDTGSDHGGGHSGQVHGRGGAEGHDHEEGSGRGRGGHSVEEKILRETGGRPVWAKEGLPEVEMGRLNVARAPQHVLDRALAEAHAALAADPATAIHSPVQNLALYREAMAVPGAWSREQAAAFLGAAADKRTPITADTVEALNLILGVTDADPAGMALAADRVRQELLAGHEDGGEDGGHDSH